MLLSVATVPPKGTHYCLRRETLSVTKVSHKKENESKVSAARSGLDAMRIPLLISPLGLSVPQLKDGNHMCYHSFSLHYIGR